MDHLVAHNTILERFFLFLDAIDVGALGSTCRSIAVPVLEYSRRHGWIRMHLTEVKALACKRDDEHVTGWQVPTLDPGQIRRLTVMMPLGQESCASSEHVDTLDLSAFTNLKAIQFKGRATVDVTDWPEHLISMEGWKYEESLSTTQLWRSMPAKLRYLSISSCGEYIPNDLPPQLTHLSLKVERNASIPTRVHEFRVPPLPCTLTHLHIKSYHATVVLPDSFPALAYLDIDIYAVRSWLPIVTAAKSIRYMRLVPFYKNSPDLAVLEPFSQFEQCSKLDLGTYFARVIPSACVSFRGSTCLSCAGAEEEESLIFPSQLQSLRLDERFTCMHPSALSKLLQQSKDLKELDVHKCAFVIPNQLDTFVARFLLNPPADSDGVVVYRTNQLRYFDVGYKGKVPHSIQLEGNGLQYVTIENCNEQRGKIAGCLSPSIEYLRLHGAIDANLLHNLPPRLRVLSLGQTGPASVIMPLAFPDTLEVLHVESSNLELLLPLPPPLKVLSLAGEVANQVFTERSLPGSLRMLLLGSEFTGSLPPLPHGIRVLNAGSATAFTGPLPPRLEALACLSNAIIATTEYTSRKFPSNLRRVVVLNTPVDAEAMEKVITEQGIECGRPWKYHINKLISTIFENGRYRVPGEERFVIDV